MLETAPPRRKDTRERLLELAEELILAKGFSATSIDELIAGVGITKSGFFYHFRDKSGLAEAMMQRYVEREKAIYDDLFRRADDLADDPLHGLLVALKLFAEMMADLPANHPGCLVASYCYQDQLFSKTVRELGAEILMPWRRGLRERFDLIAKRYPPRRDVDFDALADMAVSLIEGGRIVGQAFRSTSILPSGIMLYRDFVRGVFVG